MQNVVNNYVVPLNSCACTAAMPDTAFKAHKISINNQFLFLMRLSFIILILKLTFAGMVLAATASSQDLNSLRVSIELKNTRLVESLRILQRKSGVQFSFYEQLLDKETKKVTLNATNAPVSEVLKQMLKNTNLHYKPFRGIVVIEAKPAKLQPGTISGKILDEKGESLPGATVKLVETGTGVQTTANGSYQISASPGIYTLEVSYLSYQTKRITGIVVMEGKNTPLTVALKPGNSVLQQVVITANYKKASIEGFLVNCGRHRQTQSNHICRVYGLKILFLCFDHCKIRLR